MITSSINDFSPRVDKSPIRTGVTPSVLLSRSHAPKSTLGSIAESSSEGKKPLQTDLPNPKDVATKARFQLQRQARKLLPNERVAQCLRTVAPDYMYVSVRYNPDRQTASFRNLVVCESDYGCPVCAHRRAEQHRHELAVALVQAAKMDLFPVLLTFTMRHHKGDHLAALREALAGAFDSTFSGRWYQDLKADYMIEGKIKAWETTYGTNGHHPHLHVLMFLGMELAGRWLEKFGDEIKRRYLEQVRARGFDATWSNGVDIQTADSAIADYIAKFGREPIKRTWGVDSEIARLTVKKGKLDGLTPFELLAASEGDPECLDRFRLIYPSLDETRLKTRAGELYQEIFYSFKGKPRLYWGAMKRKLGLDQALIDFAAANPDPDQNSVDMVLIERGPEWSKVIDGPGRGDLRADLQIVCRTGDAFKVMEWLNAHEIRGVVPDVARQFTVEMYRQEIAQENHERNNQVSPGTGSRSQPPPAEAARLRHIESQYDGREQGFNLRGGWEARRSAIRGDNHH